MIAVPRRWRDLSARRSLSVALATLLFAGASGLASTGPSRADEASFVTFGPDEPAFVNGAIGYFDVIDEASPAADFRLEYRHDEGLWIFKPWVGLEVTSDGAFYPVGGLLADILLGEHVVITPSLGIGGYFNDLGGKDLGSTFEVRTQLEIGYRFEDKSRLGLAASHISNGGISSHNPGTEVLTVYYSYPLGSAD